MLSGISVININMPEAVYNAKVLVTTAGTRVQLTSDVTGIKSGVTIKALDTNTGLIYVGDVSVTSANGYQLAAGETSFFEVKNRALIYIDSAENVDGITYITSGAVSIVPVITSVSPVGGLPADDTKTITISGNNFIGVSSVTIDSNPCTSINVTSVTSLTAVVPTGTVGAKTVVVIGVGGTGTLASGYTYEDAPTASGISPSVGNYLGGTSVTITGTNFVSTPFVTSVTIGAAPCTTVVAASDTSITAITPAGTVGARDVVITTASGAATLAGAFTYNAFSNLEGMFFDGIDDNISTTDGWPELSTPAYSISLWFKAIQPYDGYLFDICNTLYPAAFRSRISISAGGTLKISEGNADTVSFDSSYKNVDYCISDEFWHHYAITSPGTAGGTVTFYLDGTLRGTFAGKAPGGNLATTRLFVACRALNLYDDVNGSHDEFSIFNAELSYAQVIALYNDGIPTDLSGHANLKHWWRFESALGDTYAVVEDRKGTWHLNSVASVPILQEEVPYAIATKVSPYHGLNSATTAITITGSNLADVSAVTIGGAACTSVSASAGSVVATSPTGSAGAQDIIVTDTVNNSAVTLPGGFFYRTGAVPAWENTKSVELDGTNAFASSEAWPELADSGSGYSVSFWFKAVLPIISGRHLFELSDLPYPGRYRLRLSTSGTAGSLVLYEGNADTLSFDYTITYPPSVIVDADWHHYAITSPGTDGGTVTFYADGVLKKTLLGKEPGSDLAYVQLWIGCRNAWMNNMAGNFDEFAIFGAKLPATGTLSVASLFNLGTPQDLTGLADLQHYYRMGDGIGDTAAIIRDQAGGMDLDLTEGTPVIDTDVP